MPKPDDDLIQIAFEEHKKNVGLALIHLRDARSIVQSIPEIRPHRALPKAALLLATAAIETNLSYLSGIAVRFIAARPKKFSAAHMDFVRGVQQLVDDNGKIVEKKVYHPLTERMQIIPSLLARAIDRQYRPSSRSAASRKMRRTIACRDTIVHPSWDRYVAEAGWWEAAEAVDAVELYLQTVDAALSPYLPGYMFMLRTIKGPTKHDVGVGYRTLGKKAPERAKSTMEEVGIVGVMSGEWLDSVFMTSIALGHPTEADSDGSMLTRAALVLLYAMLDAQLSVVAQWRMRENPVLFTETELLFLNEAAVGVNHHGEVWVDTTQHPFKKRIKAIPAVLARCVDRIDFLPDLGGSRGNALLTGYDLRNRVMHSTSPSAPLPRVSKQELRAASGAVRAYFEDLANRVPKAFGHMDVFLRDVGPLSQKLESQFIRSSLKPKTG